MMKTMNNNPHFGGEWSELRNTLLTPKERADIEARVGIITSIINARNEEHLTQKDIEEKSGVRQPIIARLERGTTDPRLSTVLKVLHSIGKTIVVVPVSPNVAEKPNGGDAPITLQMH